jgi:hypothetical protein
MADDEAAPETIGMTFVPFVTSRPKKDGALA